MSPAGPLPLRYQPPAVHYPAQPGWGLYGVLGLAYALPAGVLLLWRWQQSLDAWPHQLIWWLAVLVWVASGAALMHWLRHLPHGWLVWTGSAWRWFGHGDVAYTGATGTLAVSAVSTISATSAVQATDGGLPVQCQLVLDMQHAMLLRLYSATNTSMGTSASIGTSANGGAMGMAAHPVRSSQPSHPALWCWVSRSSATLHWHNLRCAVHGSSNQRLNR